MWLWWRTSSQHWERSIGESSSYFVLLALNYDYSFILFLCPLYLILLDLGVIQPTPCILDWLCWGGWGHQRLIVVCLCVLRSWVMAWFNCLPWILLLAIWTFLNTKLFTLNGLHVGLSVGEINDSSVCMYVRMCVCVIKNTVLYCSKIATNYSSLLHGIALDRRLVRLCRCLSKNRNSNSEQ